uniref:Uncharacterized protein n=1 Tax=Anopheles dirus TaxID=7168 RepID=A0A182NYC6_9DIPT
RLRPSREPRVCSLVEDAYFFSCKHHPLCSGCSEGKQRTKEKNPKCTGDPNTILWVADGIVRTPQIRLEAHTNSRALCRGLWQTGSNGIERVGAAADSRYWFGVVVCS